MSKKIEVSIKNNKITIEITTEWIKKECKNKDWRATHSIGKLINEFDAAEYLVDVIKEPSISCGNGEVSPVELMLMNLLQEAYNDGEDFFDE